MSTSPGISMEDHQNVVFLTTKLMGKANKIFDRLETSNIDFFLFYFENVAEVQKEEKEEGHAQKSNF